MRMYCILRLSDLSDGGGSSSGGSGSLSCYRFVNGSKKQTNKAYASTRLHKEPYDVERCGDNMRLCLDITADLPWVIRDIENDLTTFVVEIPTKTAGKEKDDDGEEGQDEDNQGENGEDEYNDDGDDDDDSFEPDEDGLYSFWGDIDDDEEEDEDMNDASPLLAYSQVKKDLRLAASRGRTLRYYFRCPKKKNEKALWLQAFAKLGRLSSESRRNRGLFGSAAALAPTSQPKSRTRSATSAHFDRLTTELDRGGGGSISEAELDGQEQMRVKEYRVRPGYAYPQRWMTHRELTEDMLEPSTQFHDLRLPPASASSPELGLLRVEVMQCLGLPKPRPNATSSSIDPNAVVYLVCGSYAFATDVIPSCADPMWLRGMRRACAVPIYHGYARLYAGVFHDDGSKSKKDMFIGRAVVELARLRPGCTYDVTLPLRKSTNVYSRRPRGAVRLRFHLEYRDERQVVLSYLPELQKMSDTTTTVTLTCGDPKAFRNVVLTVHGSHLPGKFSTDQFKATIREFKFVQKATRRLLEQFAKDLIVWKNPAVSGFVFYAWMHCCYANSVALVPVYVMSFVFLQLMGNYARTVAGGSTGQGLLPPTWEEMFLAAICAPNKDSPCIAPLDMRDRESLREERPLLSMDISRRSLKDNYVIQMHEPRGLSVFRGLGFIEKNDYRTCSQMEFPFSSLAGYPRFRVEESVRASKEISSNSNSGLADEGSDDDDFEEELEDDGEGLLGDSRHLGVSQTCSELAYQPRLAFKKPLPEQNIDKKLMKDDKTLAEELKEIEEKVNKVTLNLFNDQAYIVKDTSTPPWGKGRRTETEIAYNVKRDLDKLLGSGQYSQWNPVVKKITSQFEPVFRIMSVILYAYRALYNIFTWQDPYMSFWFSIGCIGMIATLCFVPWQSVMFLTGLVSIGPQNWLIRIFKEYFGIGRSYRPSRLMRAFRELIKPDDDDDNEKQKGKNKKGEACAQPVFQCHAAANKPFDERRGNSSGAQHVVVPYTPLICQRFYDWPPDSQFARVVVGMQAQSPLMPFQGEIFVPKMTRQLFAARRSKPLTQPLSQPDAEVPLHLLPPLEKQSNKQSVRSDLNDKNGRDKNVAASSEFFKRTMNSLNESIAKRGRDKDSKDTLKNTVISFRKKFDSQDEDISVVTTDLTCKQTEEEKSGNRFNKGGKGLLSASKRLTSKFNPTKSTLSTRSETESGKLLLSPFLSNRRNAPDEEEVQGGAEPVLDENVSDMINAGVEPIIEASVGTHGAHESSVESGSGNRPVPSKTRHDHADARVEDIDPASATIDATGGVGDADAGEDLNASGEEQQESVPASFLCFPDEAIGEAEVEGGGEDTSIPKPLLTAKVEKGSIIENVSDVSGPISMEQFQVQNDKSVGAEDADKAEIIGPMSMTQHAIDARKEDNHDVSTQTTQADSSHCMQAPEGGGAEASNIEELVALKLELASLRTSNDHYREKLRKTEAERDSLRVQYDALQQKDYREKSQKYNLLKLKVPMGRSRDDA